MSVMNLSLKLSSFHINLDVKRSFIEGNRKLQKALRAENSFNKAIIRKEAYVIEFYKNSYL